MIASIRCSKLNISQFLFLLPEGSTRRRKSQAAESQAARNEERRVFLSEFICLVRCFHCETPRHGSSLVLLGIFSPMLSYFPSWIAEFLESLPEIVSPAGSEPSALQSSAALSLRVEPQARIVISLIHAMEFQHEFCPQPESESSSCFFPVFCRVEVLSRFPLASGPDSVQCQARTYHHPLHMLPVAGADHWQASGSGRWRERSTRIKSTCRISGNMLSPWIRTTNRLSGLVRFSCTIQSRR